MGGVRSPEQRPREGRRLASEGSGGSEVEAGGTAAERHGHSIVSLLWLRDRATTGRCENQQRCVLSQFWRPAV